MALVNTVGTFYPNEMFRIGDKDGRKRVILIQTGGSTAVGLTATSQLSMLQSAGATELGCTANSLHLLTCDFHVTLPTTTCEVSLYMGTDRIAQLATATTGQVHFNFGSIGLVGPDVVTTNSVYLYCSVGACTVKGWHVTAYYEN